MTFQTKNYREFRPKRQSNHIHRFAMRQLGCWNLLSSRWRST